MVGERELHIRTEKDFFAAMYDEGYVGEIANMVWTLACGVAATDDWARRAILGGKCNECGDVTTAPSDPNEIIRRLIEFENSE
jgi:hypothetical protein